jgi:hypothetical protein
MFVGPKIEIKNNLVKKFTRLPVSVQEKLALLLLDLKESGPNQPTWPNFSKLRKNEYHCHLAHRWVECWRNEKGTITIEVYYVGSRENAPY